MNNDSYKLKYYKYKNKYLELKQKTLNNQKGGILPAQTGTIGFFIDNTKLGNNHLGFSVIFKQIYGGLGRNVPIDLSYDQLCELSCAVVKQDQIAKEWAFPIVKRYNHFTQETLKYKRNSNFKAVIEKKEDVENTKTEVLLCLDELNKIIDDEMKKDKKSHIGFINKQIRYCIVCKVNLLTKNEIIQIYEYPQEKKST